MKFNTPEVIKNKGNITIDIEEVNIEVFVANNEIIDVITDIIVKNKEN